MAIAASNFAFDAPLPVGPELQVVTGTFTGPASYTSGGETISAAILAAAGLTKIRTFNFAGSLTRASTGGGYPISYDAASNKIRVQMDGNGAATPLAELTATTDISAFKVGFIIYGV